MRDIVENIFSLINHGGIVIYPLILNGLIIWYLIIADLFDEKPENRRIINVFIASSTLLGLLGTVSGMIETFRIITYSDLYSKPDLISAGISKALITTQFGLAQAVPAFILSRFIVYKRSSKRGSK